MERIYAWSEKRGPPLPLPLLGDEAGKLTIKRIYHRQPMPVLSSRATEVVCAIMQLKAVLTIVAMETPLARVLVSKISAGMIQDRGPHVALKQKL